MKFVQILLVLALSLALVHAQDKATSTTDNQSATNATEGQNATNQALKDAITVEIELVEKQINLYTQKLIALKALRDKYISNNVTIPNLHENFFDKWDQYKQKYTAGATTQAPRTQAYQQQPVYTQPAGARQPAGEAPPGAYATAGDFEVQRAEVALASRIAKKTAFNTNGTLTELHYLPLKSAQRSNLGDELLPTHLIVTVADNQDLKFFDPNGIPITTINTGEEISKIATNVFVDELFVICLTKDQKILSYTIEPVRVPLDENGQPIVQDPSSKQKPRAKSFKVEYNYTLDSTLNLREQAFYSELTSATTNVSIVPTQPEFYTTFITTVSKSQKVHLLGTQQGEIIVLNKNGTYMGKIKLADSPIVSLHRMYPNVLYATKKTVGYISPTNLAIVNPICEEISDEIVDAIPDLYANSYFYVLLRNGEFLIYEHKYNTNSCKVVSKRNSALNSEERDYPLGKIYNIKYHVLLRTDPTQNTLLAFNVTDPIFPDPESFNGLAVTLLPPEETVDQQVHFHTLRNGVLTTLITAFTIPNDGTPSRVTVFEATMPKPQALEWFSNMRFPIIVLGIVLVVGYQLWNSKKKREDRARNGKGKKKGMREFEEEAQELEEEIRNMGKNLKVGAFQGNDDEEEEEEEEIPAYKKLSRKKNQ